jgi:hypothetical protein
VNRLDKFKRSRKQEARVAKELRGRPVPNSGAGRNIYAKEDAEGSLFLCQCKYTDKKSYSLKEAEFEKTERHAARKLKLPIWHIQFPTREVAVIRWDDFRQMMLDAGYDDPL